MTGPLFLVKASDDLLSRCRCRRALAALPEPSAEPWKGAGWLHHCITCRQPFAFARAEEVPEELDELATLDLGAAADDEAISSWIEHMSLLLSHVKADREYVFLDGTLIPTNALSVELEGWFTDHRLTSVPHVEARRNPALLQALLENPGYWLEGARRRMRAEA